MCSRSFSRVWYPVMFHLKPSNIIFGICVSLARRPFTSTFINMSAVEASCATADENSVAFVTVPNVEVGKELSHGIVKNKLAACVNLIPQITSIYEWEGKINEDSEVLLMIKTRKSRVDDLTEYVRQNHPYSVCEVISLPIQNGNPAYLDWINTVVPHKQNIENK